MVWDLISSLTEAEVVATEAVAEVGEGPALLFAEILMGRGADRGVVDHDLHLEIGMVEGQEGPEVEVEVEAEIADTSLSTEADFGIVGIIEIEIMSMAEEEVLIRVAMIMSLPMELEATEEVMIETMIMEVVVVDGGPVLLLNLLEKELVVVVGAAGMFGMCLEKDLQRR